MSNFIIIVGVALYPEAGNGNPKSPCGDHRFSLLIHSVAPPHCGHSGALTRSVDCVEELSAAAESAAAQGTT
jgi:hypothetical protein